MSAATAQPLKLEVGRAYRTRDGRRALVMEKASFPVRHYADYHGEVDGASKSWREDGRYWGLCEVEHDLVAEWDAPENSKQEQPIDESLTALAKELAASLKTIKQTFEDLSGAATDLRERVFLDGVLAVIEANGDAALAKAKAAGML